MTFGTRFGPIEVHPLPIPHDCTDGFLGAVLATPARLSRPGVRGAMSTFTKLDTLEPGSRASAAISTTAAGIAATAISFAESELDLGYRLVIAPQD
jgi:hypothetical protein